MITRAELEAWHDATRFKHVETAYVRVPKEIVKRLLRLLGVKSTSRYRK